MTLAGLEDLLSDRLNELGSRGALKGREKVITAVKPAWDGYGPRCCLEGEGGREFLLMNSNSYLGLSIHEEVIKAGEEAVRAFGAGPGAVRFISGTYRCHVALEKRLAEFHGREAAMLFSSAYSTVMGVLPQLISDDTLVVSDELNHNCIINAIRLSRSAGKEVYRHLDMDDLERILKEHGGTRSRAVVVTDGIFSMRGDHAPLNRLVGICSKYEPSFREGIITVADDSHGVGAFGATGRGTEEYTRTDVDVLIATLGKAFGVNGGYVVSSSRLISYLRETTPFYIYSNPVTPAEAAAAIKSIDIVDSPQGLELLEKMRKMTSRLEKGLSLMGYEIIPGEHPIIPLMIRDTQKTSQLVRYLYENGILATGLGFPVVPKGDEEIRLQVSAGHSEKDIDLLLAVLKSFKDR